MSAAPAEPASPRLSATLLLLRDDPFEVLMVRRASRRGDAFSSALVFPGGVVEPGDHDPAWRARCDGADSLMDDGLTDEERALRIAAIRETFEEVGVLIAEPSEVPNASGRDFATLVRDGVRRLPLDRLVPFAHWITPEAAPRRFDTHFFLARLPAGAEPVCDDAEVVALEWATPRDLVARAEQGDEGILFPTRLNLMRLAESSDVEAALAAARARPRFTVLPRIERHDGRPRATIPAEAGYGVTAEWRADRA